MDKAIGFISNVFLIGVFHFFILDIEITPKYLALNI